jgi:hypothetical protein
VVIEADPVRKVEVTTLRTGWIYLERNGLPAAFLPDRQEVFSHTAAIPEYP